MTPDVYEKIKSVLDDLRRSSPEGREQILRAMFPDDPAALREALAFVSNIDLLDRYDGTAIPPVDSIDKYEIGECLGRGGMAIVFAGRNDLGRPVAVKFLNRDLAGDEVFVARFLREARIAASLPKNPHVVETLDSGVKDGQHYIVLEYIDGRTLADVVSELETGPAGSVGVPPGLVLLLLEEVCEGLGLAHSRDCVHRDIKPSNVIVGRDGIARIADFGIARSIHAQSPVLTDPSAVIGTQGYMCPEQARPHARLDPRCDIYSLGAVANRLLGLRDSGRDGAGPTDVALATPPRLAALVRRMMSPDPRDRHDSIDQVLIEVRGCQADLDPGNALRSERREWLKDLVRDPWETVERYRRWSATGRGGGGRKATWMVVPAVVAAVVAVVVWMAFRPRGDTTVPAISSTPDSVSMRSALEFVRRDTMPRENIKQLANPPRVVFTTMIPVNITLDGQAVPRGDGDHELILACDRPHVIKIENRDKFISRTIELPAMASGEIRDFGVLYLPTGRLKLNSIVPFSVALDDSILGVSQREYDEFEVGEGRHELTVSRDGRELDRAVMNVNGQRWVLEPRERHGDTYVFEIDVSGGQVHGLVCVFEER